MKLGNVPTSRVGPVLERLIAERWPEALRNEDEAGGLEILAEKVDCDRDAIAHIISQRHEGCEFDLVDRLLCALGPGVDIWRGELLDIYENVTLLQRCRREGCKVMFIPRMGGPNGFQRFCGAKCRQMHSLQQRGLVKDARKRNLKAACRNGHKRTPENTADDGACRICDREQQRRKRAEMTPEQREAKRAYERAWHAKRREAEAMKDNRDPAALGERLVNLSTSLGVPMTKVYDEVICDSGEDWTGDGLMSNNPAEHHSQTPQAHLAVGTSSASPSGARTTSASCSWSGGNSSRR